MKKICSIGLSFLDDNPMADLPTEKIAFLLILTLAAAYLSVRLCKNAYDLKRMLKVFLVVQVPLEICAFFVGIPVFLEIGTFLMGIVLTVYFSNRRFNNEK